MKHKETDKKKKICSMSQEEDKRFSECEFGAHGES